MLNVQHDKSGCQTGFGLQMLKYKKLRIKVVAKSNPHRTEFLDEPVDSVENGDDEVGLGELDDEGGAALRALHVRRNVPLLLLVHPPLYAGLVHPLRRPTAPGSGNDLVTFAKPPLNSLRRYRISIWKLFQATRTCTGGPKPR